MSESTTKPGDSSTATGIGNLLMSRIFGVSKQQFSIAGLINVSDHLRKLDEQAFTPLLISIGPIHYSNNLQDTIRREDEIHFYYAETIVSSISSDDFVTMIVVDGVFILEYFIRQSDPHLHSAWNDLIAEWMPPILKFDLLLLENQLLFFVLEMLFVLAFSAGLGLKLHSLRELAFKFFECYNFQGMAFEDFNANIEHFTDLFRLFYLGGQLPDRRSGGVKLSYSATQLHEAGVKFKGVKFDEEMGCYIGYSGFLDIRFDLNNEVLEIPCIKLNDERVRLIRNIIALEQSNYVGDAYVTDYFVILNFLIDTSKDVDLLCDKGILINYLGDSNAAASAINSLNTNILWDYMNPKYSKICEDLNASYKKRWHKWKATLWRQYFSTLWRAASTNATIILLLLTATQTICSLKSTKW